MLDDDDLPYEIRRCSLSAWLGSVTSSSGGMIQGTGRSGEAMPDVRALQHYGFASDPPKDTLTAFIETEAGVVSVAEGGPRPSLTGGQVALYDAAGARVKLLNASSARRMELGTGGTVKDAARKGDAVGAGSTPTTGMAAWIGLVSAAINSLAPGSIPPGCPSDFGAITGGSASVGIED